jgi:hypothetical protein
MFFNAYEGRYAQFLYMNGLRAQARVDRWPLASFASHSTQHTALTQEHC